MWVQVAAHSCDTTRECAAKDPEMETTLQSLFSLNME